MPAEPQEAIVLVVAQGETTKAVRGALECWAAEGLLRQALWAEVAGAPAAAVHREVTAYTLTGEECGLFERVAQSPARLVRLVCAQFVPAGPEREGMITAAARAVETELRQRLAGRQQLRTVNVVLPAAATTGLTGHLLIGRWDANVVVAPEDRVSDRQADQRVRADHNYAAHAAATCATVAGLWRGMTGGPFDGHAGAQHSAKTVVAARGFGRVLLAPGLVHRILGELLQIRRDGSRALAHAVGGVPAPDPERTVREAVEQFTAGADGGSLRARPPEGLERPGRPRRQTLRQTLATVWGPGWGRPNPGAAPRAAWKRLADRTNEQAVRWARGLSSQATSRPRLPAGAGGGAGTGRGSGRGDTAAGAGNDRTSTRAGGLLDPGVPTADELATVSAGMRALLHELGDTAPPPAASPQLWRAFRAVAFGLADGGPLPAFMEPARADAKRAVVLDPALIAPVPGADPISLTELLPPGGEADPPDEEADPPGGEAGPPKEETDPATATRAHDFDLYTVRQVRDWLARDLNDADTSRTQAHQTLTAWLDRRERSFATAVAARLADQLGHARTAVGDHLRKVADGPGDRRHHAAWRQTAWQARRWLRGLAVAAGASVLVGVLFAAGQEPRPALGFLAGGPAAAAAGALAVLAVARHLLARHARAQELAAHAHVEHVLAVRDWARETLRLATLHQQLCDWGEIVARVLHAPTGDIGEDYDPPHEPDALPHTLAFRFGVGEQRPADTAQLRTDAIRCVFSRGWLGRVYGSCVARAESTMPTARHLEAGPDANDLDTDMHGAVRAHLLEKVLRAGFPVRAWARDAGGRLVEELGRRPAAELFPRMRPLEGPGTAGPRNPSGPAVSRPTLEFLEELAPSGPEATTFNVALWAPAGIADQDHHVHQTVGWGLPDHAETAATLRREPLRPPVTAGGSCMFLAVRLDLTREVPHLHLNPFEPTPEPERRYDSDAPDLG